jgi:hypothetical protein
MSKLLSEGDVRRRISRFIREGNWKRSDVLIPEYYVENASRRADLVTANGYLVAYEIKSDLDDLDRLNGQIEVFSRNFEAVTVACTSRHIKAVLEMVPEFVGVTCVTEHTVTVQREAATCEIKDQDIWLSHLPISAIRDALSSRSIECPRQGRDVILQVARSNLSISELRSEVLKYLKTTKRQQRIAMEREKRTISKADPLAEHRAMLRDYLESRGIIL